MTNDHLHALVTGATSGIGYATVAALLARGARVCAVGRNLSPLEELAQELDEQKRLDIRHADLDVDNDVLGLVDHVRGAFEDLNVLIHCAGTIAAGVVRSAPVEDLDRQYRTNLRAPYLLTQSLLPLLEKNQGQIVFVNSTAGRRAAAGTAQYAATKHGLRALADSLRDEVNESGIRVVSVYPGRTATPMQESLHHSEGRAYDPSELMQPEDVAATIVAALIVPRSAEVTDVAVRPMKKPRPPETTG